MSKLWSLFDKISEKLKCSTSAEINGFHNEMYYSSFYWKFDHYLTVMVTIQPWHLRTFFNETCFIYLLQIVCENSFVQLCDSSKKSLD